MGNKHLNEKNLNALVTEALAIEDKEAKEVGHLGYMARALTQATMPHRKTDASEFVRKNGNFTLSIIAPSRIGLPYGSIPRIIVAWMATEAVRTQCPRLVLGESLSDAMGKIGIECTGGVRGGITRFKTQSEKLFSSSVSCIYTGDKGKVINNFMFADEVELWWNPIVNETWESSITLTDKFFKEVTTYPVPIDLRAVKSLSQSPMAIDIYCWLTYRMSYLQRPTLIPWEALQGQFGADYGRVRDFKTAFLGHLRAVSVVYPEVRFEVRDSGLKLYPSKPHVAKLK